MSLPPWLKSLAARVSAADLTDRAAALTYYGFLSLFPALIVAVALIGLLGTYPDTYNEIVAALRDAAPGPVVDMVEGALDGAVRSRGGAGGLLGIGLLVTIYSASGATGAAVRAVQAVYGVKGEGAWWHGYVVRLALTLVFALLLFLTFAAILLAGPLFDWVSKLAGISDGVNNLVGLVRWPVGIAALITAGVLLYWVGSGRSRRLRELLPGAVMATVITLVATFGFNFYVSHFNTYGATYGSLGTVIVLLVWMWLSSLSLLAGAAINAELSGEAVGEGEGEPQTEPDAVSGP